MVGRAFGQRGRSKAAAAADGDQGLPEAGAVGPDEPDGDGILAALEQDSDQDDDEGELADTRLFRQLRQRPGRIVPMAFTPREGARPRKVSGHALAWTPEAVAAFAAIHREASKVAELAAANLPYAYLRGSMEVVLRGAIRLESGMGLDKGTLRAAANGKLKVPPVFAWVKGNTLASSLAAIRPILDTWISNSLFRSYAEPGHVEERLKDRVLDLARAGELVRAEPFSAKVLPWAWDGATGTARTPATAAPGASPYRELADHAARALSGKELFRGLGPMRRVISVRGRENAASLMTAPKEIEGRGRFSLVVELSVETMPAVRQPLVVMTVRKRRWLDRMDDAAFDHGRISGFVFSRDQMDRAFSFHVSRRRGEDGIGRWLVDNAFAAIRRELDLPPAINGAEEILRGSADRLNPATGTPVAQVLLTYRPGISDDWHPIKAGVPEADKHEAYTAAAEILAGAGLVPFGGLSKVEAPHNRAHEAAARMINATTLLGAMIEAAGRQGATFTPNLIAGMTDEDLDRHLHERFRLGLDSVKGGRRGIDRPSKGRNKSRGETAEDQVSLLQKLVELNREALARHHRGGAPQLVIFHHRDRAAETHVRVLKSAVKTLWGDLEVVQSRLPEGTHGPMDALPGGHAPNGKGRRARPSERSALRVAAWSTVADQIRSSGRPTLCLVMAQKFYADPSSGEAPRRDDPVNKPSTRRALAGAGANVQFLIPPQAVPDGSLDLADFLLRAQAAVKDLVSAHAGRIDIMPDAVAACFPDPETRPRQVIGVTVVRKQKGRANRLEPTFLAVAVCIDVDSGLCSARVAHEGADGGYAATAWAPFRDALSTVARISPARLAREAKDQKIRFMRFVDEVITAAVEDGARPLVIIDSSNAARLWPWLTDQKLDPGKIDIGEREWVQENWSGARIVRVRQDLAPDLIEEKWIDLAETWEADDRPRESLRADDVDPVPAHTNPGGGLFRVAVAESGCVTYLSVGRKTLHKEKRGLSCHRTVPLPGKRMSKVDGRYVHLEPRSNAAGDAVLGFVHWDVHTDQWPSPNPLEVVVAMRDPADDPDRIARMIECLRYGFGHYREWTSLPAPLFFERVVRDYVSHFAIEDAETDEADAEPA